MNVKQGREDEAATPDKKSRSNGAAVNQQKTQSPGQKRGIVAKPAEVGEAVLDEESVRGRFGWELIGDNPVPYIFRGTQKYCSMRMVVIGALNKYLNCLHQNIYNCTCVRSYHITEAEGRLLNEINIEHCDYYYGEDLFTPPGDIIRLTDALEFYKFLSSCYMTLANGESYSSGRYGFIHINKDSVVPYTLYNDQKYVPLFCFEGETESLKQSAKKLEGWDLSYLKFCCYVQGIRKELFEHESCLVISLNDVKNCYPAGTLFEEYWPEGSVGSRLLVQRNTQPKPPSNNQKHNLCPPQSRKTGPTTRSMYLSAAGSSQMKPPKYLTQVPPPLVPTNQEQTKAQNATPGYMLSEEQPNEDDTQPPPMIPIGQFLANGGVLPTILCTQQRRHMGAIDQNSAPRDNMTNQQSSKTVPEEQRTMSNGHNGKLIPIPELLTGSKHTPYKMQKALVDGKFLPCINMKPYVSAEVLVTIPDLIINFFNDIPVESCQRVMRLLGVDLYKPNNSQMHVLMEAGKCQNVNDVVPLVQVKNVIDNMPQLKYILGPGPNVSNKRQRKN